VPFVCPVWSIECLDRTIIVQTICILGVGRYLAPAINNRNDIATACVFCVHLITLLLKIALTLRRILLLSIFLPAEVTITVLLVTVYVNLVQLIKSYR
jgi:hypothetical protein